MVGCQVPEDIENLPKSRKEALAAGVLYYFTGNACVRGHISKRCTRNSECYSCVLCRGARRRETPEGRSADLLRFKRYRETDRGRRSKRRYQARRKALRGKATPLWADLNAIDVFFNACPEGFHVDHIIPQNGRNVCGLHVLENLQYLPAKENLSKLNRVDPLSLEALVCVLPEYRSYSAPDPFCAPVVIKLTLGNF